MLSSILTVPLFHVVTESSAEWCRTYSEQRDNTKRQLVTYRKLKNNGNLCKNPINTSRVSDISGGRGAAKFR